MRKTKENKSINTINSLNPLKNQNRIQILYESHLEGSVRIPIPFYGNAIYEDGIRRHVGN